jgi:hypothetical protein
MSVMLQQLVREWRDEAERARRRYADESVARLCEIHAQELEAALRSSLDDQLSLGEAAQLSGYSRSHLRRLLDNGKVPNVGRPGAPRVRICDLPFRPGRMTADRALRTQTEKRPPRPGVRRISVE